MTSGPTVSIVIPNKNRCDELVQTLASVQAQSYSHFECIVIDDNSTDAYEERIALFRTDSRFSFIKQAPDRGGAPAARNDGARRSVGEFVIFLDSDDLLAPFCLEQRVRCMRAKPALDFAVFPCELFRETIGDTRLLWNVDTPEADLDRFIRHDVPWQTTAPIWRRASLERVLPWDEAARSAQDWEFHLRAVLAGLKYERLGTIDFYWRMASANRQSIGKSSVMDKAYHDSRLQLYRRIYKHISDRGGMTEARRRWFVGMYFTAAETIAKKLHRGEGRRAWKHAWTDGLVTAAQYRQGWWLLVNARWPARYESMRASLESKWPREYFLPRSDTFMKAPIPAQPPFAASNAEVA
ncbi:MAG TPA: glycosyltransferase family A protein [Tepidisphaeraceae bacterium]|nr:glycosyltransferase family A protein [Tepidisphaeraceae bacterium]